MQIFSMSNNRMENLIEKKDNVVGIRNRLSVYFSIVLFIVLYTWILIRKNEFNNYIHVILLFIVTFIISKVLIYFMKRFLQSKSVINSIINDYEINIESDKLDITDNNIYWIPERLNENLEYFVLNLQSNVKLEAEIEGTFDENKNTLLFLPYSKEQNWLKPYREYTIKSKYYGESGQAIEGIYKLAYVYTGDKFVVYDEFVKYRFPSINIPKLYFSLLIKISNVIKKCFSLEENRNYLSSVNNLLNYYSCSKGVRNKINEFKDDKRILIKGKRGCGKTEFVNHYYRKYKKVIISVNNERAYGDPISIIYSAIRKNFSGLDLFNSKLNEFFRFKISPFAFCFALTSGLFSNFFDDGSNTLNKVICFLLVYFVSFFCQYDIIAFINNSSATNRLVFLDLLKTIFDTKDVVLIIEDLDRLDEDGISKNILYDWKSEIATISQMLNKLPTTKSKLIVSLSDLGDDKKDVFSDDEMYKYFDVIIDFDNNQNQQEIIKEINIDNEENLRIYKGILKTSKIIKNEEEIDNCNNFREINKLISKYK